MKRLTFLGKAMFVAFVALTSLSSCIKEEALNAEADIPGVSLGENSPLIRYPVINNNDIILYANTGDSILAPEFTLTEGATIEPASGTKRQFFTAHDSFFQDPLTYEDDTVKVFKAIPQTYTVTSQDGKWKKTYTVNIVNNATPSDFHFDNVHYYVNDEKNYFQIFYETVAGQVIDWGSGNAGSMITLAMTGGNANDASAYPTCQADGGVSGKCAKLTTISTGSLGAMFGAPLAAGNLFLGSFAVDMSDMPASTHFGVPLRNTAPKSLSGYYKYQPGKTFLKLNADKNGTVEVPGRTDDFAIYAVVYEVTKDEPYLDGHTISTSKNIVLRAEVKDHVVGNDWVHFEVPFEQQNGKTIDPQKLANGLYNIAIVMSSSADGATFEGAIGSTLYVDEFHLNY